MASGHLEEDDKWSSEREDKWSTMNDGKWSSETEVMTSGRHKRTPSDSVFTSTRSKEKPS